MTEHLKVGDNVRFHTVAHGWRFGKVIGVHVDNLGIRPSGLEMATVRFLNGSPRDEAIAQFRLDRCE